MIIFTLFRNSKTNSQYNLFFRKSYRFTDIPGNRLISVSYILFLSLLWKFDDATLYRVSDLDYISRHCIYFTISGNYWRKQNKSERSWCRAKYILTYACDFKKYELILVLRIRIFVRVERHVCLWTRRGRIFKTKFSMMLVWYTAGIPHLWVYTCHVVVLVPSQHFQNCWPSCYTSIHGSWKNDC